MKLKTICVLLFVTVLAISIAGQKNTRLPEITLHASLANGGSFSRSFFDFERGDRGTKEKWDLLYGSLRVGEDYDWLSASHANDNRSLIRDLGKLDWSDQIDCPFIEPLPKLADGKIRTIGVDSSGDNGKAWAKGNGIYVKAVVGHTYAMHVKDDDSDFYVLFRVDSVVRGESCTISWKLTDAPKSAF